MGPLIIFLVLLQLYMPKHVPDTFNPQRDRKKLTANIKNTDVVEINDEVYMWAH